MSKIPFIEACGSNYEIGLAIGQELRKQISRLIRIEEKDYRKESGRPLSHYIKKADGVIGASKKYFPGYVEEVLGMAEGSGTDFSTMLALGCDDDLVFNCTSVAGLSKEGAILGHNEDWLKDHIDSQYICRIGQKGKPNSISLSYAGHLPGFSAGLNSAGCAYAENSIYVKGTKKSGLPLQFLTRAHLDVGKSGDLIRIASMSDKMIGGSSLVAFKGGIFDIEFTPKGHDIIKGGKYLAHTNHILSKSLLPQERRRKKESVLRLERANELMRAGVFDFRSAKKILADHLHRPFSICCHEYEKGGENPYSTIASVIIKVEKREFFVARGNPCMSEYEQFRL